MKILVLVLSVGILIIPSTFAETNFPSISDRSLLVEGEDATDAEGHGIYQLTRVDNRATQKYLKEFTVFAARQGHDLFHPNGNFGTLLVADGKLAMYFGGMEAAAKFLTTRIGKITTDKDAETVMLLLPALFSYKVVCEPPSYRDGHRSMIKDKSEWTYDFKPLNNGWLITCTLLFDPDIMSCKRVTIALDKNGKLTVSKSKDVYAQGGYQ